MPTRRVAAALAALTLCGGFASAAHARIEAATTIDGPNPAVLELGGVAIAEDGTGGVTYRRFEDGRTHIYVARFSGRRWHAPQRVDWGQPYNSAWPRIAAANGGRLVVTWTQDGGEGLDGLYSAVLPRGGQRFLAPTLIDYTIGEDRATHPSLVMNAGGSALIAYAAVTAFTARDLPPGYVRGEVRLARFDGSRWQRLGLVANRNRAAPLPLPTAESGPRVALDAAGNGVVAWREPDDDFVDRVWARRIFGTRFGIPLVASPQRTGAELVRAGADAFALAEDELGRAVVALRQLPDPRDRSAPPRLYTNLLEESSAESSGRFAGPEPVEAGAGTGAPSVALGGREDAVLGFARGASALFTHRSGPGPFAAHEAGGALAAPAPGVAAGEDRRGTLAFATGTAGGRVRVQQLSGARPTNDLEVGGPGGGPIRELAVAGSPRGDALVAFAQGADNQRQIAVAVVDAAPSRFALTLPVGWTRQRSPLLTWERAQDALGAVEYTVEIGGRRVARTRSTRLRLKEGTLRQGAHDVRVEARDSVGQTTAADPDAYRLDRVPPRAQAQLRRNRRVVVRITDPGGKRAAGPEPQASTVAWGDRKTSDGVTRTASHRYRRRGTYTITVAMVDRAGNRSSQRLRIAVR